MKALTVTQPPEPYVDATEMARQLGLSVSTLHRLRTSGVIVEGTCTFGLRTRRFLPSVVKAELARHELRERNRRYREEAA